MQLSFLTKPFTEVDALVYFLHVFQCLTVLNNVARHYVAQNEPLPE